LGSMFDDCNSFFKGNGRNAAVRLTLREQYA